MTDLSSASLPARRKREETIEKRKRGKLKEILSH
jgi:hypothetical protein